MKTKLLLLSLLASIIFSTSPAQIEPHWVLVRSMVSDDNSDTLQIYYLSTDNMINLTPNRILIKSRTDTIKVIQVENGSSERMPDGSFLIRKAIPGSRELNLTLIGNRNWKYRAVEIRRTFLYFALKNYYVPKGSRPKYTIDDLLRNKIIIVVPEARLDSILNIRGFQLSIGPVPFQDENSFLSPVFYGDSIPSDFSESLKKYFSGPKEVRRLYIKLHRLQIQVSDSIVSLDTFYSTDWMVYKDSLNMLLENIMGSADYFDPNKARSNIRIKLEGNPNTHDLETVKYIVGEINSLKINIKAKIVRSFPSLVIQIDTMDTLLGRSRSTTQRERDFMKRITDQNHYSAMITGRDTLSREIRKEGTSLFFPKLSFATIFLSSDLPDQHTRDIFLWKQITRSLTDIYPPPESRYSIVPSIKGTTGFALKDRQILKIIFSKKFYDRAKLFGGSKPQIQSEVLLIVFVSLLLFFIFYEINNYFSISGIIKNPFLRNSVYALLIAQLFIVTGLLVDKDFYNWLLQWEIQLCGFALVAVWLFFTSDKLLLKYFKISWMRLLLNPVLTLISLWISYQFVYLFVRAEFLRFITIDINAKFIALSIVAVRFYLQYENEKIRSLLQEKDSEVTRQKELKNRAELSTLQAKINPHFLYNALNSIAALAHIDAKRTEEMALSLSKLFRYNMNREEDMVSTIRQEIEMVQLYLQIEKQRYADRLSFDIITDENLNDRQVPRFLIQPLVENAIRHGISQITGQGIIKLKIYEQAKNLFIEIYDNGPAFPQGLITGYGLQNTYDKLTLVYKKPYEIRFVNEPEKYIQIKL